MEAAVRRRQGEPCEGYCKGKKIITIIKAQVHNLYRGQYHGNHASNKIFEMNT
jgi:hypothetical protein